METTLFDVPETPGYTLVNSLCSDLFICCTVIKCTSLIEANVVLDEQIFLEELLLVYHNLVTPFLRKKEEGQGESLQVYDIFCKCYNEILSVTALHVQNLYSLHSKRTSTLDDFIIISQGHEFIRIYKFYLQVICDLIVLGGFHHISNIVTPAAEFMNVFRGRMNDKDAKSNEGVILFALQRPIFRLNR